MLPVMQASVSLSPPSEMAVRMQSSKSVPSRKARMAWAHELTYEIDEMAVLALYNRISNIQRLDRATTLTEVKEIVDEAIANSEKFSIKKVFFSKKYKDDDYVILHEKDFEE